ncbi:MAG: NAD(P)-dependent glycerol-3-phosphate dehydrogenase [Pseudonocardiaceae bacterium]|nr:NAD(P)-dependent glycerol-3-phosphate dehydrogenase [Pseudonocardiaceae bacterium]
MADMRVAVFGAGSWGTAFAKVLADAGTDVVLWARRSEVSEAIAERRENPDYLPGVPLPASLRSTSDPLVALDGAAAVVLAVPSQSLRHNLTAWRGLIDPSSTLVSLAKGVELGTLKRMSQVITEVLDVPESHVAVVSGPNLAKEIADEQPTGADPMTFAGLAGLGDLVATCSSPLSRNRSFGMRLGKGETVAQAQTAAHGQVAEGVKSCSSIRELALRHGVEMPITEVVHRVCHDGFDPREMAGELIGRKTKPER